MTVYACCRKDVVSVSPDALAGDVARLMQSMNIGSVIVTRNERPQGIVTDRDLVIRVIAEGKNPEETRIRDIMSGDLVVLDEEMGLMEALAYVRTKGVRRMPVVDREGKLRGIITVDDIIRLLIQELSCIGTIIEEES
jgi:CBS domain-containing protein